MPARATFSLLLAAICCSGCAPGREMWNWSILRRINYESEYHQSERQIEDHEYDLAKEAWKSHRDNHSQLDYSADFGRGFRDGYAGYLHTGHLDPPSAPPERYRWFQQDGPAGYQASQEWFSGYRMGAMAAANSGHRQTLLIPAAAPSDQVRRSLPPFGVHLPPSTFPTPAILPGPEPVPAPLPGELREPEPAMFFPEDLSVGGRLGRGAVMGAAGYAPSGTALVGPARWPGNPLRAYDHQPPMNSPPPQQRAELQVLPPVGSHSVQPTSVEFPR